MIYRIFINFVQSFFQFFGVQVNRFNPSTSEVALINYLLDKYRISSVVDIGANEGQFALKLRKKGRYKGQIMSFEPVSSSFQVLLKNSQKDKKWHVIQSAVGDQEGNISINISQNSVSSSILKVKKHTIEAEAGTAIINTEIVPINTLDNLLPPPLYSDNLWLKIDVQGFEREVLKGASGVLQHAKVVQIELAVIPSYDQGPCLEDIILYLRKEGFMLYSIMSGFRNLKTGQMYEVEGFFVRSAK